MNAGEQPANLTVVVVGASGDLARRKIVPGLFALYCQQLLPSSFRVVGFARSVLSDAEFRDKLAEHLTCRYSAVGECDERVREFLDCCHYVAGDYGSTDAMLDLYTRLRGLEAGGAASRLFYLAVPPSVFLDACRSIGNAGFVTCGQVPPWSRVIVEKPFGRDRRSSDDLTREMAEIFAESQTFRIDHYLGKELVQNLLVLRFANIVFEPIWNKDFIQRVEIVWKEDLGLEGRGGYFDQYGIVRDVMQNHLMQILALVAMEPPPRLDAADIAAAKAETLRHISPVTLGDLVLGQYHDSRHNGRRYPGYTEDPGVPDDSATPTFAAVRLAIDCPRWAGVPFLITAGKGLGSRMTEIRICFREVPENRFCHWDACPDPNELIIRVQPDESIRLSIANKVPGINQRVQSRSLDLLYHAAFPELIPDAYERLILDVIRGDHSLFIRSDELAAAWDIFTPVLHAIERDGVRPQPYPFGSSGPELPCEWDVA